MMQGHLEPKTDKKQRTAKEINRGMGNNHTQDRAQREAFKECLKAHIIEEYRKAQDMTEDEKERRIASVDRMTAYLLAFLDIGKVIPTENGLVFFSDDEATFIPGDELDA